MTIHPQGNAREQNLHLKRDSVYSRAQGEVPFSSTSLSNKDGTETEHGVVNVTQHGEIRAQACSVIYVIHMDTWNYIREEELW